MDGLKYITPGNAVFSENKGGFVGLKFDGVSYERVSIYRAFPFSNTDLYLSVRDRSGSEIGIIKDVNEFSKKEKQCIQSELRRRYFLPKINKIKAAKEEFGYIYWDVVTDVGDKKFIMKKDSNNFISLGVHMVLVTDVDGSRYEISDYTKLDSKSYKRIELML